MKTLKILKNQYFWLGIILIVGLLVRLYKIDNPVADWHSWRQADTAAVARNFFKDGFNPLYPQGNDMSDITSTGKINVHRYRFVEFPIYNSLVYFLYLLRGGVDESLARLVSVVMSLGSTVFLFLIVRRCWDKVSALVSSLVFAVLPYNIYYSRVILPEPTLIFFSLGMFYFVERWIWEEKTWLYLFSVIFTASAFLVKPMAIFYLLPLAYSYLKKEKRLFPIPARYFLFIIPSLVPLAAWRLWMSQHPEGIPASAWLLNGNGIRFKPAFWRWILGDRFGREILTVPGTVLFFLGLLKKPLGKQSALLHFLALSSLAYLAIFATGNVRHDYYQILIIPALSIFVSAGFLTLVRGATGLIPRIWTIPLGILFFALIFVLGWYEVRGLYQINNPSIIEAGKMADKILPKDAEVIAPYDGDTAFLYQTNRYGWPIVPFSIEDLIHKYGASYYISVNFDSLTKELMTKYKILVNNPKYVIIDLTQKATSSASKK